MNPKVLERLSEIIKKAKGGPLLDHELAFLRARREYLKERHLAIVGKFLPVSKDEVKRKAEKEKLAVESQELDADEMNRLAHPAIKKEQVPYRELQKEAKKLKLPYVGISREKLVKSILKTKPSKEAGKDAKDKKEK